MSTLSRHCFIPMVTLCFAKTYLKLFGLHYIRTVSRISLGERHERLHHLVRDRHIDPEQ
jgi:hypothetical protein